MHHNQADKGFSFGITNLREDKSYMNAWALMMSARFPVPSDDQAEASCLIRQIRKLTFAVTTCALLRQNTNFGEDWRRFFLLRKMGLKWISAPETLLTEINPGICQ